MKWTPASWRERKASQQPKYASASAVGEAFATVSALPPLVTSAEIDELRCLLAEVATGARFVLQGGDCAERFIDCNASRIESKLQVLIQSGLIIGWGAQVPMLRIGRIAGQYAKPRSRDCEMINGETVASFRGDVVNSIDPRARSADPSRMVQGYFHSAATLNFMRSAVSADTLRWTRPGAWTLEHVKCTHSRREYQAILDDVLHSLHGASSPPGPAPHTLRTNPTDRQPSSNTPKDPKMAASGTGTSPMDAVYPRMEYRDTAGSTPIYTSHEGLLLEYEAALTRLDPSSGQYYDHSAHFLWIGERTRQLDQAHVEFFRGVANPIGIKIGPTITPQELVSLIQVLWPHPSSTPGKITLITRLGASRVAECLPRLIRAVQDADLPVVWICDPCHGNTELTEHGVKTRNFDTMLLEMERVLEAHAACGSRLGGVHLELTGDDVTECTGGGEALTASDLDRQYTTYCDPRLNYSQSIDFSFRLAQLLRAPRGTAATACVLSATPQSAEIACLTASAEAHPVPLVEHSSIESLPQQSTRLDTIQVSVAGSSAPAITSDGRGSPTTSSRSTMISIETAAAKTGASARKGGIKRKANADADTAADAETNKGTDALRYSKHSVQKQHAAAATAGILGVYSTGAPARLISNSNGVDPSSSPALLAESFS